MAIAKKVQMQPQDLEFKQDEIVIGNLAELPSQPVIIQRLHTLMSRDSVSNTAVAQVIETDQAFTARVLRLVNSPFYGFSRRIASVEEAITMLGFNAIHQLLLTTSVLETLSLDNRVINVQSFWRHSFGVGVIAKHLLFRADQDTREASFISGILHDVGRLILVKADPKKYAAFLSGGEMAVDLDNERKFFGADHQKLGELLARKWNFPEIVRIAIAFHHLPHQAGEHLHLASAVNIADILCRVMNIGASDNFYVTAFFPEAWQALGLSRNDLKRALRNALAEIKNTDQIMSELQ